MNVQAAQANVLQLLAALVQCESFVREKLTKGQATREVLKEVLAGETEVREHRDARVVAQLRRLEQLAWQHDSDNDANDGDDRRCHYCGLFECREEKMDRCGRCKRTYSGDEHCLIAPSSFLVSSHYSHFFRCLLLLQGVPEE
jgi:hypothetical protein